MCCVLGTVLVFRGDRAVVACGMRCRGLHVYFLVCVSMTGSSLQRGSCVQDLCVHALKLLRKLVETENKDTAESSLEWEGNWLEKYGKVRSDGQATASLARPRSVSAAVGAWRVTDLCALLTCACYSLVRVTHLCALLTCARYSLVRVVYSRCHSASTRCKSSCSRWV